MNEQLYKLCSEFLACKEVSRQQKWCCLREVGQPFLRSILQNVNNPKYLKFASWHFVPAGSCQVFNSESCHDIWISNNPEFRVRLPCSVCPYTHVHSECTHNVMNAKRPRILMTIFFRLRKSMYSVCAYRLTYLLTYSLHGAESFLRS